MLEEISNLARDHMNKTLDNLHRELAGIRTGKANPGILEGIRVDYFGQMVPLKQVANIAVPDPRLITLQPWDKSIIVAIEKAIQASELGLNPQSDGTLIRLPVPPLTEERRRELVRVVKRMGEESKVAVRNVRRDSNDRIKRLEKEHEISEDLKRVKQEEIQEMTDAYIKKIDESVATKEKEIMEI
jgi:ribosome recycling factor